MVAANTIHRRGAAIALGLLCEVASPVVAQTSPPSAPPFETLVEVRINAVARAEEFSLLVVARPLEGAVQAQERCVVPAGATSCTARLATMASVLSVELRSAGFWSSSAAVAAGSTTTILDAWPTSTYRGEVAIRGGASAAAADQVTVRFRAAPGIERPVSEGAVSCPVTGRKWSCEIPAGRLDVSVRLRGHATRHWLGQVLTAGGVLDAGRVEFLPGASVCGSVLIEGKAPARSAPTRLYLQAGEDRGKEQPLFAGLAASANDRGFFQFEGIPPGSYVLTAQRDGFVAHRQPCGSSRIVKPY